MGRRGTALAGQSAPSAGRLGVSQVADEAGYWLYRAGDLDSGELDKAADKNDPYTMRRAGDWRASATRWEQLGCPYERATALADADDEEALRTP